MTRTADIHLDYRPRPWQAECHKARARFKVLAVHRRAGKTELAVMELVDKALRAGTKLPVFVYLAPFLKQAKAIAWTRLKQKVRPLVRVDAAVVSEGELTVTFRHNGAVIRLFGADNPDALRGLGLDGIVVDEVAWIDPVMWEEVVQPTLADRQGWALFIGTPHGVNLFSELFYRAQKLEGWYAKRWTVYETNSLPKHEVARIKAETPSEAAFAREFLCDFTAAGEDQLISLADTLEASERVYVERDVVHAARVLGVDPARFGDDRSVIVKRQGLQMFDPLVYRSIDNMDLAARVANVIQSFGPDATFIDSGAGAGVIDRLRQLGYSVVEVPFGGKATKPNLFVNRRTEMWFEVREWLQSGGAIPDDAALKQELATPIYWYDSAGRLVLEPKDKIKERLPGAASPDIADALALTFAAPVPPRRVEPEFALPRQRRDYDPYQRFLEERRR